MASLRSCHWYHSAVMSSNNYGPCWYSACSSILFGFQNCWDIPVLLRWLSLLLLFFTSVWAAEIFHRWSWKGPHFQECKTPYGIIIISLIIIIMYYLYIVKDVVISLLKFRLSEICGGRLVTSELFDVIENQWEMHFNFRINKIGGLDAEYIQRGPLKTCEAYTNISSGEVSKQNLNRCCYQWMMLIWERRDTLIVSRSGVTIHCQRRARAQVPKRITYEILPWRMSFSLEHRESSEKRYVRVNEQQKQTQRRKIEKLIGDSNKYSNIDHTKTVINLSNKSISQQQTFLLNKGLKFSIAPKIIPKIDLMLELDSATERSDPNISRT